MSVDKFQPHVLVLPEDDANRQIANGFLLALDPTVLRKIQVLEEAGGWTKVLDRFELDHVLGMDRYASRLMVLLIDFDGHPDRLDAARRRVPERFKNRVFILGALKEPEGLKSAGLGSYEAIGIALARDCHEKTDNTWSHALLRHNAGELDRLRQRVRPILFLCH